MLSKSIRENKKQVLYWTYLLVVGVLFYILNICTPMFSDDWHYNFIFGTYIPIESVSDILISQYKHYFEYNGRFIPHFIVQFFDGITGKGLFNIANSIVFVLFLHLITLIAAPNKKHSIAIITFVTFIVFVFPTDFKACYLWMSGACNYLWVATILMLFHLTFQKDIRNKRIYPLLFLFGVICGWTHEGIIIGACAGYFFYMLFNRDKITKSQMWLIAGLYIGAALLIFSPANFNRAIGCNVGSFDVVSYIQHFINFKDASILILMIIASVLLRKKYTFRQFVQRNIFYILSIVVLSFFLLIIKSVSYRALFGMEFFALIILVTLLSKFEYKNIIIILLNVFLIIGSVPVLSAAMANNEETDKLVQQMKENNDWIVRTNEKRLNSIMEKYVLGMFFDENSEFYRSCDPNAWDIKLIAKHFNKDSIVFLPEKFIDEIKTESYKYDEFNIPTDLPFYAKRLSSNENPQKVMYLMSECDYSALPFYIRPFAPKLGIYSLMELEADRFNVLELYGERYLLVLKNWSIDDRLRGIVYE